jgi:hypothetical protein
VRVLGLRVSRQYADAGCSSVYRQPMVEVLKPRVSNRISGRISCQPWICVGGTNHVCRTLVETNTKSIEIAKGLRPQQRRQNVILATVRLMHLGQYNRTSVPKAANKPWSATPHCTIAYDPQRVPGGSLANTS